jgi:protocatechuate 3,4-dioxygenase beta subunit
MSIRRVQLVAIIVTIASMLVAQEESTAKQNGSISGTVLQAASGRPIAKAKVHLFTAPARSDSTTPSSVREIPEQVILTDATGRYEFPDLAPGSYWVSAEKTGFMDTSARGRMMDMRSVELGSAQKLANVNFRLAESAVVTGRVLNEDGEPMAHVLISLLRRNHTLRGISLEPDLEAQTNDLGEYRVFGLKPGSYFILASLMESGTRIVRTGAVQKQLIYPPLFYPSVRDQEDAAQLNLVGGSEERADFRFAPVVASTIRGRVLNRPRDSSGKPAAIRLVDISGAGTLPQQMPHTAQVLPDGTFELSGVTVGKHTLVATTVDRPTLRSSPGETASSPSQSYLGQAVVSTSEADTNGVEITLEAVNDRIRGRLVLDNPKVSRGGLTLGLKPLSDADSSLLASAAEASASVSENGEFTLKAPLPGIYMVDVSASADGYQDFYLKSVLVDGADVTNTGMKFPVSNNSSMDILLASDGAHITGIVTDDKNQPIPSASVVLIPESQFRNRLDLYLVDQSDQYGRFEFRGVMPGSYTALLIPAGAEEGIFLDPEYVKAHLSEGVALRALPNGMDAIQIKTPILTASQ